MPEPLMVRPELLSVDLTGKTYVITGANSGIGLVIARQLARQGATVVMACRRTGEGERAAAEIRKDQPAARLDVMELDLGDLASVRAFAKAFKAQHAKLHGLVNNAGVMNTPLGRTKDGFETQFGINHLGHFLLTALLTDTLKASAPSRVVSLSSCFHVEAMGRKGAIHFDDPNYRQRRYDGWEAYAQSKLANVLHARQLARNLAGTGVICVSVHPGWVRTNLIRNTMPVCAQNLMRPFLRFGGMIEPWEGAQTTLHALLAPEVTGQSGEYFSQTGPYKDRQARRGAWPLRSPNPIAHDDAVALRLWEVSEALTGIHPDKAQAEAALPG
jgi:NAD(P)-dependent dehydrogenase (short-subunit alcohol dehydrogenase family)